MGRRTDNPARSSAGGRPQCLSSGPTDNAAQMYGDLNVVRRRDASTAVELRWGEAQSSLSMTMLLYFVAYSLVMHSCEGPTDFSGQPGVCGTRPATAPASARRSPKAPIQSRATNSARSYPSKDARAAPAPPASEAAFPRRFRGPGNIRTSQTLHGSGARPLATSNPLLAVAGGCPRPPLARSQPG